MTFSLAASCPSTGQHGACTATSDVAVGARVPFAEAGVGVVLTQHRTDPRLGPRCLALLRSGCSASEAVDAVVASTPHRAWRQLAAVDGDGRTAAYSGTLVWPCCAEVHGAQCVAIGNVLVDPAVAQAMVEAFASAPDEPLAERLVRALEAGLAAGGEEGPLSSAALLVVEAQPFPLVDLRVDAAPEPVEALRTLWDGYRPQVREFVIRALDPDRAGAPDRAI
jgi:uncharacterized Ntn-hydrolase superfamily protein